MAKIKDRISSIRSITQRFAGVVDPHRRSKLIAREMKRAKINLESHNSLIEFALGLNTAKKTLRGLRKQSVGNLHKGGDIMRGVMPREMPTAFIGQHAKGSPELKQVQTAATARHQEIVRRSNLRKGYKKFKNRKPTKPPVPGESIKGPPPKRQLTPRQKIDIRRVNQTKNAASKIQPGSIHVADSSTLKQPGMPVIPGMSQEREAQYLKKGIKIRDPVKLGIHETAHAGQPRGYGKKQLKAGSTYQDAVNADPAGYRLGSSKKIKDTGQDLQRTVIPEERRANVAAHGQVKKHGTPKEAEEYKRWANAQMKEGYRNPSYELAKSQERNKLHGDDWTPLTLKQKKDMLRRPEMKHIRSKHVNLSEIFELRKKSSKRDREEARRLAKLRSLTGSGVFGQWWL